MGESIQGASQQAGGEGLGSFLIMMVAMFAIFYFLLIRPQRKQQQQHQALLQSLKKGDEVVLSSGFVGKIFAVEEKTVTVELAPGTRVKVLKQAVSSLASAQLEGKSAASGSGAPVAVSGAKGDEKDGEATAEDGEKKGGKKKSKSA